MAQLSFSFENYFNKNPFNEEDFILLPENSTAVEFLNKFFAQKDYINSPIQSLILKGDGSSGKTHLLHVFAKKFNAEIINRKNISLVNPANFFSKNHFYIFDDVDEVSDEELILHLINSALEAKAFLILSGKNNWQFTLRDLNSRLKNIIDIAIENPSLDSIKQLLANGFSRRQIKLSNQIIDFIADNIDRSYEATLIAIKKIEFYCCESGKDLSMKMVKAILY